MLKVVSFYCFVQTGDNVWTLDSWTLNNKHYRYMYIHQCRGNTYLGTYSFKMNMLLEKKGHMHQWEFVQEMCPKYET